MRHRITGLALAAFVVFGPHTAAAQSPGEAAVRETIAAIDSSPDWSATFRTMSYDAPTDTVTVSGLEVRSDEGTVDVAIETLKVVGYVETVDGGFSAAAVTVDTATVKSGFATVAIADVELNDLASPLIAAYSYDPAKPFTSMIRFYADILDARLRSGRVGQVEVIQTFNNVQSRVVYSHLRVDDFANGRVGSMRAGPMHMELPSPQGLMTMTIGGVESRDMDLDAFVHVYDPDSYANGIGDMRWRTAMAYGAYHDLEMEFPGVKVALGELAIENFSLRQPERSFAQVFDVVLANPLMSEAEADELIKPHMLDMFSAFGIGRFAIDRFEIATGGIDRFRLAGFRMLDFSIDGLGEFAIEGLDVAVPDQGSASLGLFAFGGIAFPDIEALKSAMAMADRGRDPDFREVLPTLGFIEVAGLDVRIPAKDPLRLERFRLDLGDYVGYLPTSIATEMVGLVVPVSIIDDPQSREMFRRLGYETIDASYGLEVRWDEATETLDVENLHFGARGIGSLAIDLALAGLPRSAILTPETLPQVIPGLALVRGAFTFTDDSIVGKGLDILAETMKAPPDRFRQQFADAMPFLLSMTALNDPKLMAIVQRSGLLGRLTPVVKEFVATPGSSITVTLAPTSPVPLPAIMEASERAPDTLVDLLGISIAGETAAPPPAPAPETPRSGATEPDSMRKSLEPAN